MTDTLLAQAERFYRSEMHDHFLYQSLAERSRDEDLAKQLRRISRMEAGHAKFWGRVIEARGGRPPEVAPPRLKIRLLGLIAHVVSPLWLVALLEMGEGGAQQAYHAIWRAQLLDDKEQRALAAVVLDEMEHEQVFRQEVERLGGSNVRDFVLGMNDGLVEILGAVTGLSAAYPGAPQVVAVSGLIVGVAGALSMGIGAFISVRSQRQVNEARRRHMDILFEVAPQRAGEALREKLHESGLPDEVSHEVATRIGDNPDAVRGLLLESVEENELRSALFTGFAYLFGVIFPLTPYFFAEDSFSALLGSVLFAGLALASVGLSIAVLSGISIRTKILEMVVSGLTAAALAYGFGLAMQRLFGIEAG